LANEALSAREAEVEATPAGGKLRPGPGRLRKEVVAHQLTRVHRALIDVVAEQGYEALKVRDVVRRAEVSSRAFYELFSSKDDSFLYAYDRLTRRATRRMVAVQAGENDWRRRVRLIFEEFAQQVAQDPKAARLVLVDIYRASRSCLDHAWRAERAFEAVLRECLARAPRGVTLPRPIVEGIAGGIAGIARDYVAAGRPGALLESRDDLVEWVLRYADGSAAELAVLDRGSIWRDTMLELAVAPTNGRGSNDRTIGGRALILKRTAALVVENGYSALTVERIRAEADVSRREFRGYFSSVEDCYVAAFEQRAKEVMAQAAQAQAAARTWGGGVYRAIAAYWAQTSGDPFLAQALLTTDFPAGSAGARSRKRTIRAIGDQLLEAIPYDNRPASTDLETSLHAIWALARHHLSSNISPQRNLSATLAYLLLAPAIGSRATLLAIANEQ